MKKRVWHVDAAFGLLIGAAYYFDGPGSPDNAIKPMTTHEDRWLMCIDGQPPIDWRCPDGERL